MMPYGRPEFAIRESTILEYTYERFIKLQVRRYRYRDFYHQHEHLDSNF